MERPDLTLIKEAARDLMDYFDKERHRVIDDEEFRNAAVSAAKVAGFVAGVDEDEELKDSIAAVALRLEEAFNRG